MKKRIPSWAFVEGWKPLLTSNDSGTRGPFYILPIESSLQIIFCWIVGCGIPCFNSSPEWKLAFWSRSPLPIFPPGSRNNWSRNSNCRLKRCFKFWVYESKVTKWSCYPVWEQTTNIANKEDESVGGSLCSGDGGGRAVRDVPHHTRAQVEQSPD